MKLFSMCWNNFQLSVENNPEQLWFPFSFLSDWSRKLAPLSQPINRVSVTRVFPRIMQFATVFTLISRWLVVMFPLLCYMAVVTSLDWFYHTQS